MPWEKVEAILNSQTLEVYYMKLTTKRDERGVQRELIMAARCNICQQRELKYIEDTYFCDHCNNLMTKEDVVTQADHLRQ